ncbi:hypothetical protein HY486_04705 [Candidatus Woesearchaeota archaeon]|nr:hypothetical protein [Candidatus Woesearchaeota archaeon]
MPEGFKKGTDGVYPVFFLDDTVIGLDTSLTDSFEGNAFLECGCQDYKKREQRFDEGKSYKRQQKSQELGWDCVATCEHIILLKRYFIRPLLEHVIAVIAESHPNRKTETTATFLRSREAGIFPRIAHEVAAKYLEGSAQTH